MVVQTPIRGLRSFCLAAEYLSFKQAAQALFLTPSAVSHQIKQLEDYLGFDLFVRKARKIALTAQGELFYQALSPQLNGLAQTIDHFKQKKQNQVIVVSMPEFLASEIFIPKLSYWTALNPTIDIQVDTSKPGQGGESKVDLSIVLTRGKPLGSQVYELFPIKYMPACNRSLHERLGDSGFEVIEQAPLITHKSRPWAWHQWAQSAGLDDFNPSQMIQLDSMFAVVRAAQQGMGIALVPLPLSHAWFSDGLLVEMFNKPLLTNDSYYLVQHDDENTDRALADFALWVRSTFHS